jgi:hypothetical protein
LIEYGLDYVDLLDRNNAARHNARRAWRQRIEAAGARLAEEEERRKAGTAGVHAAAGRQRSGAVPALRGSSPSRRDPMPVFFVVGLAVVSLFAIFGFISIGQFLQHIWGG